jgi:hypothetical protein
MRFKTREKLAVMLIIYLLAIPASAGSSIEIDKMLSNNSLTNGDNLSVSIFVTNSGNEKTEGVLTDLFPQFSSPLAMNYDRNSMAPSIEWNASLEPGEKKEFRYVLSFPSIPRTLNKKEYPFPKAKFIASSGEEYQSNSIAVLIEGLPQMDCDYDFVCDDGENFKNCPQDCSSSGKDGYCNPIKNSVCDPDCASGLDRDCDTNSAISHDKSEGYLGYLFVIVLVILISVFIYKKRHYDKNESK